MDEKLYIRVILDEKGGILDFDATIEGLEYQKSEVIGKNWFDIFIEPEEQLEILKQFQANFNSENLLDKNLWQHTTDLKTKDGHHKLIDFENTILVYENGKKVLFSNGLEHYSTIY